jgi:hypothetical protein
MMLLIRYILIGLIIYLIVRSFIRLGEEENPPGRSEPEKKSKISRKSVSKAVGEYIDYEEIEK